MISVDRRSFRNLYEQDQGEFFRLLPEVLSEGHLQLSEFSVRDLFEDFVDGGREIIDSWSPKRGDGHGIMLTEAGAVNTSAFTNISGQVVYTKVREAFQDTEFLWPQLVETVPTEFNGERIPGMGRIGDEALAVGESENYPMAGFSEEWIDTPKTTKRGMIVPLTKEVIFFDRTNLLLQRAGEVGNWLGVNKEKRVLDVVTGQTNNHKYKGTSENTYGNTFTGFTLDNIAGSNALVDWTDVETAEQLFAEMKDPITGEPINVVPTTMIVPTALKHTAARIVNATEVLYGARTTSATATGQDSAGTVTRSASPQFNYNILSNAYVSDRGSSTTTWYLGDPKKAFWYMENFPLSTIQAPANSHDEFHRDIVQQWKASERGVCAVIGPHYMVQSTG